MSLPLISGAGSDVKDGPLCAPSLNETRPRASQTYEKAGMITATRHVDTNDDVQHDANDAVPSGDHVGAGKGLVLLSALVPLLAGYIALATAFSLEQTLFGGLLILIYWGGAKDMARKELPPIVLGAFGGLGLAFLAYQLPFSYGSLGLVLSLGMLVLAIYLDIVKLARLVINPPFMLYFTVGTIPRLNNPEVLASAAKALLLVCAYMLVLTMAFTTVTIVKDALRRSARKVS